MKKFITVVAVTLMASGAAFAGTLAYGFINDNAPTVVGLSPTSGTATFVRCQNFSGGTVNLTAVMADSLGVPFNSNTGTLVSGALFSWRPRNFQGNPPSGSGATANGSLIVFHSGAPNALGGNVVEIVSNGSRLGFLAQEQI